MNAGLLDFFVLESSECVERLDFLLARSGASAPDFEAFARNARALRGSATMAKVAGIASLATGLERVVRGLRDGSLAWNEQLRGAVIAAIDDLKIVIRGVRTWGPDEQHRADVRTRELNTLAPAFRRRSSLTPITASGNARFLADETAAVAAGLQRFADSPSQLAVLSETLARVRALRGVASLGDLPPLGEVISAVDEAGKPVELGTASPGDAHRELFRSAAAVLREGSDAIHHGGWPNVDSAAVQAFTAAAAKFIEGALDADFVVPVSTLFPDTVGAHALHAAPDPPTTAAQRFRVEVVSHAEHLRRLVSDARRAVDPPSRQRVGHELRGAVRSLWRAAESFGEGAVARTLHSLIEGAGSLDAASLTAIDEAAAILTTSDTAPMAPRFDALATPARSATPVGTPRVPTPSAGAPLEPASRAATPTTFPRVATPAAAAEPIDEGITGPALRRALGASLAGLAGLEDESLSQPDDVEEESVVPIGDLLYRGRAALQRAVALGDAFKTAAVPTSPDALAELYDLLALSATE